MWCIWIFKFVEDKNLKYSNHLKIFGGKTTFCKGSFFTTKNMIWQILNQTSAWIAVNFIRNHCVNFLRMILLVKTRPKLPLMGSFNCLVALQNWPMVFTECKLYLALACNLMNANTVCLKLHYIFGNFSLKIKTNLQSIYNN